STLGDFNVDQSPGNVGVIHDNFVSSWDDGEGRWDWSGDRSESPETQKRIVITGGAGQIAYALLPLIIHGNIFGPDCKVSLRLLDVEACSTALEGVAMEIRDCDCDLVCRN
ncbi:unnamed protein product, partial [Choristocarpus tenellus]